MDHVGQPDHESGRRGQRQVDAGEHALERGNDEHQQHGHGDDGHGEDHPRVDHRAFDLTDESLVLLEKHRKAQQNGVENTARLTRGDHVDVELGEHLGVVAKGIGKGGARLHIRLHLADRLREELIFCLLSEDVEALHQRQARIYHCGELPGEVDDLLHPDAAAERQGHVLRLLPHRHGDQPLPPQIPDNSFTAGKIDVAALDLAGNRLSAVDEDWHLSVPAYYQLSQAHRKRSLPLSQTGTGSPAKRKSSFGSEERFNASSSLMSFVSTSWYSASLSVCMPCFLPACIRP